MSHQKFNINCHTSNTIDNIHNRSIKIIIVSEMSLLSVTSSLPDWSPAGGAYFRGKRTLKLGGDWWTENQTASKESQKYHEKNCGLHECVVPDGLGERRNSTCSFTAPRSWLRISNVGSSAVSIFVPRTSVSLEAICPVTMVS